MKRSYNRHLGLSALMMVMAAPSGALAQDEGGEKKPSMHEMARISSLPKAHADFSHFLYRPAGDKVVEQPDANRLLFRNKQGEPDGYAERRGNAIVYFDRHGKVTQVQSFNDDDPPSE